MDKNKLSPYIRVAMYSSLMPSFTISERTLFDYEIILVTGGECKITINGTPYICRENDVVFIRPNILHSFEVSEKGEFYQPHIHFDAVYDENSIKRVISYKPRDKMNEKERQLIAEDVFSDIPIPDVFTPYDSKSFARVFFDIIDIYQNKQDNYELSYKSKMLELLSMILKQFDAKTVCKNNSISDTIVLIKSYIDNNYMTAITLDSLSKQFYINKYTMLRRFKEIYKINIMSYYRRLRIEYAKKALENTNISVYALAEKLSFTDIYSFSRFFKNETHLSPTEYRKNIID